MNWIKKNSSRALNDQVTTLSLPRNSCYMHSVVYFIFCSKAMNWSMNCQFSRAEKILAATLCSEATQRSILFAQPSFCQPLSDFCFCIFFNKFHHHGVLLSSGVSVAKKTLDLWTHSSAFIDPQARAISTPNVNIIPSLFHYLIV